MWYIELLTKVKFACAAGELLGICAFTTLLSYFKILFSVFLFRLCLFIRWPYNVKPNLQNGIHTLWLSSSLLYTPPSHSHYNMRWFRFMRLLMSACLQLAFIFLNLLHYIATFYIQTYTIIICQKNISVYHILHSGQGCKIPLLNIMTITMFLKKTLFAFFCNSLRQKA